MTRRSNPPGPPKTPSPGRIPEGGGSGPHTLSDPEPSPPEFLVVGGHLFVTVQAPEIPQGSLAHYVGTNLLVIWRDDEPERQARMIRFPVDVQPEKAVLRMVNGVLDLEVPVVSARSAATRSRPPRASPRTSDPSPSSSSDTSPWNDLHDEA